MKKKNKNDKNFKEVIMRIEEVRNFLKISKSKFSSEFGMKPQTYNNFIGIQGSKPNIELISGTIEVFNVNPHWLLFGNGFMFDRGLSLKKENKKGDEIFDRIEILEGEVKRLWAFRDGFVNLLIKNKEIKIEK